MPSINYHNLLEKVLVNVAWEKGAYVIEDLLLYPNKIIFLEEERRVLAHLIEKTIERNDIT